MIEPINEPIEVIALFRSGKITPLRFLWKNRCYDQLKVTSTWSAAEGEARLVFFTAVAAVNLYELSFQTRNFQWKLVKIYHE